MFVSYLTNILKLLSDPLDVLMQHDCDADPFLRLKVGSLSSFSSHMPVCTPKALSRQAAKLHCCEAGGIVSLNALRSLLQGDAQLYKVACTSYIVHLYYVHTLFDAPNAQLDCSLPIL